MIDSLLGCLAGILLALPVGFFLGLGFKKLLIDEVSYDRGFQNGYEVGKNDFYNPEAKG